MPCNQQMAESLKNLTLGHKRKREPKGNLCGNNSWKKGDILKYVISGCLYLNWKSALDAHKFISTIMNGRYEIWESPAWFTS